MRDFVFDYSQPYEDIAPLAKCNHKEADSRMVLHLISWHMATDVFKSTIDNNVIVIEVFTLQTLINT